MNGMRSKTPIALENRCLQVIPYFQLRGHFLPGRGQITGILPGGNWERVMDKLLVHATTVGTAGKQLVIHGLSKTADAEALAIGGVIVML